LKKNNRVMVSTKYSVFKKRPVKKLIKRYVRPYVVEKVVLKYKEPMKG